MAYTKRNQELRDEYEAHSTNKVHGFNELAFTPFNVTNKPTRETQHRKQTHGTIHTSDTPFLWRNEL